MKVVCQFKNMDGGEHLQQYVESKLEKVSKFELKPSVATFTFNLQRQIFSVEVSVVGPSIACAAHAEDYNFHSAVDKAVSKLITQLARRKGRVQHHKHRHLSQSGLLDRLNEQLEVQYDKQASAKKAA